MADPKSWSEAKASVCHAHGNCMLKFKSFHHVNRTDPPGTWQPRLEVTGPPPLTRGRETKAKGWIHSYQVCKELCPLSPAPSCTHWLPSRQQTLIHPCPQTTSQGHLGWQLWKSQFSGLEASLTPNRRQPSEPAWLTPLHARWELWLRRLNTGLSTS